MSRRPRTTRGITLIEMIVVISIVIGLLAMGTPALVSAKQRADQYATVNVLESVHATSQRLARQLGSAGTIYGFTLTFNATLPGGRKSANGITPWVIAAGSTTPSYQDSIDLRSEFGKALLWNGNDLRFRDDVRPGFQVKVDAALTTNPAQVHIAYEPRTGFAHASISAIPALADMTLPTKIPSRVAIRICSANGSPRNNFVIQPSGVCNARTH